MRSLPVIPAGALPLGYMSATQVETLHRCGLVYVDRFILGNNEANRYLLIGGAYHAGFAAVNKTRFKKGGDSAQSLRQMACAAFEEHVRSERGKLPKAELPHVQLGPLERESAPIWNEYINKHLGKIKPQLVEEPRFATIGGVPVRVILDVLEADRIIDFKTTQSERKKDWPARFQFKLYCVAADRAALAVAMVHRDGSDSRMQWQDVRYNLSQIRKSVEWTLRNAAHVIMQRAFTMTNPEAWWCSAKWCDLWKQCRGATCPKFPADLSSLVSSRTASKTKQSASSPSTLTHKKSRKGKRAMESE